MTVPRTTPDRPPKEDGIEWKRVAFASLKALVERAVSAQRKMSSRYGKAVAESLLAAWHAAPGVEMADALPIDVDAELVKTPHTTGTYYVRVLSEPPEENDDADSDEPIEIKGASYYVADAAAPREVRAFDAFREVETNLSRANNELTAHLSLARTQAKEADEECTKLRRDLRDAEDENARLKRKCKRLRGELEAAIEEGQPMFSDEVMADLVGKLGEYLNLPSGGTSQKYLNTLFDATVSFARELATDPELLAVIVQRKPKGWDVISGAVNMIAEKSQNPTRIAGAKNMLKLLLPAPPKRVSAKRAAREQEPEPEHAPARRKARTARETHAAPKRARQEARARNAKSRRRR